MERIKSSYAVNHYGPLFEAIVRIERPRRVIEFGILEGYSTAWILKGLAENGEGTLTSIDLFDEYPYHHAKYAFIRERFAVDIEAKRLDIRQGDFWEMAETFADNSLDMMHVDISNDGQTYGLFFHEYLRKLRPGGLAILEGGGIARDRVPWMLEYQKSPIRPVLDARRAEADIMTLEPFPSLTLVRRKG